MNSFRETELPKPLLTNGGALAALVAAGAGAFVMGILYTAATAAPAFGRLLTWYPPAGALSGMSAVTVLAWSLVWVVLHRSWSSRSLPSHRTLLIAFGLLLLGALLTFPPLARLF